jgi:DNA-binding MarR family transcriptional regulator
MASSAPPRRSKLPLYESSAEIQLRTWVQLMRTFLVMQKEVVGLISEHDVTLPQFDVMAVLWHGEGITQQELATQLLVTKGNICGLLDRLADSGWVERRQDPVDARANRLYLTAAGRRKIHAVLPAHDKVVVHMMECLTVEDTKLLRELLARLEESVVA